MAANGFVYACVMACVDVVLCSDKTAAVQRIPESRTPMPTLNMHVLQRGLETTRLVVASPDLTTYVVLCAIGALYNCLGCMQYNTSNRQHPPPTVWNYLRNFPGMLFSLTCRQNVAKPLIPYSFRFQKCGWAASTKCISPSLLC